MQLSYIQEHVVCRDLLPLYDHVGLQELICSDVRLQAPICLHLVFKLLNRLVQEARNTAGMTLYNVPRAGLYEILPLVVWLKGFQLLGKDSNKVK